MSRTRGGCRADTRKLPPATARAHHDKPQEAFMDLRKIKKLIDLLEESNLAEIEIKEGEESVRLARTPSGGAPMARPDEHPSALQSLMRISYADLRLKNKNTYQQTPP